MSTHRTNWEDGGCASFSCDGVPTGAILDAQSRTLDGGVEARQCPRCGAWLVLQWDVTIVEVPKPTEGETNV